MKEPVRLWISTVSADAWRAGFEAGRQYSSDAGRTAWTREDYHTAVRVFSRVFAERWRFGPEAALYR